MTDKYCGGQTGCQPIFPCQRRGYKQLIVREQRTKQSWTWCFPFQPIWFRSPRCSSSIISCLFCRFGTTSLAWAESRHNECWTEMHQDLQALFPAWNLAWSLQLFASSLFSEYMLNYDLNWALNDYLPQHLTRHTKFGGIVLSGRESDRDTMWYALSQSIFDFHSPRWGHVVRSHRKKLG